MSDIQRDREERQHVIEILQKEKKTALHDNKWAFDYAIASIKTDLKYDLLYEETSGHADKQADKPITQNCESCRYYGSRHKVCNYCYKCSLWTEQEPTTKNDLAHNLCGTCINYKCEFQSGIVRTKCAFYMPPTESNCSEIPTGSTTKDYLGVDAISRQAINGYIDYILNHGLGKRKSFDFIEKFVANLPPVTSQELSRNMKEIEEVINCDADAETKCKMISNILTAKLHYFEEAKFDMVDTLRKLQTDVDKVAHYRTKDDLTLVVDLDDINKIIYQEIDALRG